MHTSLPLQARDDRPGPIGIFDSGIGGLTVFKEIAVRLPQYDYVYLGDNARVPYGTRSFETVYHYTRECVQHLFDLGCRLVILACNTASAKALRTLQQRDLIELPLLYKVLGVIRPTTEVIGAYTTTRHVGVFGTPGTITSDSYKIEINKFFPDIAVFQQACPLWVPLVEANEHEEPGADFFVKKYTDLLMKQSPQIDSIILACTHYPLLAKKIAQHLPTGVRLLVQGELVAASLANYLERHPEVEALCTRHGGKRYFTTEAPELFNSKAAIFLGHAVKSEALIS